MYEELIKALRYCDLVVNKTEDTLQCGVCPYFERCSDLDNQAADALEAQSAQLAAKDAEIERLNERLETKETLLRLQETTMSMLGSNKDTVIHMLNRSKDALASVTEERDAAVALIEKVNNIAVGAIEDGPYQDGEEAKIFSGIETMTRTPEKQGEEG